MYEQQQSRTIFKFYFNVLAVTYVGLVPRNSSLSLKLLTIHSHEAFFLQSVFFCTVLKRKGRTFAKVL